MYSIFKEQIIMKYIYLILTVLMLLCLAPMPYGYYTFIRFESMVGFGDTLEQ